MFTGGIPELPTTGPNLGPDTHIDIPNDNKRSSSQPCAIPCYPSTERQHTAQLLHRYSSSPLASHKNVSVSSAQKKKKKTQWKLPLHLKNLRSQLTTPIFLGILSHNQSLRNPCRIFSQHSENSPPHHRTTQKSSLHFLFGGDGETSVHDTLHHWLDSSFRIRATVGVTAYPHEASRNFRSQIAVTERRRS